MKSIIVSILLLQAALFHLGCLAARYRQRSSMEIKYNSHCELTPCTTNDSSKSAVNLFQTIASDSDSPIKTNYIWSNIGGPPMIITTRSSQDSALLIDWNSILKTDSTNSLITEQTPTTTTTSQAQSSNDSTTTTPKPTPPPKPVTDGFHFNVTQDGAIGLLFEKIILFDDTDKSGSFTPDKPHTQIDWGQIVWDVASKTTYNKDDFLKTNLRMRPNHKYLNGSLLVKIAIPRDHKADRQREVPHLKLSSKSLSVVILVDGINPPENFTNTRLAMTFVIVVQSDSDKVALDTDSESLISDEYTPGVFRIKSFQFRSKDTNVVAPPVEDQSESSGLIAQIDGKPIEPARPIAPIPSVDRDKLGFLYWKEVAYTDRRKIISRTVDVFDSSIPMDMDTLPDISQPFYQFFKYEPASGPRPRYKLFRFNLIFGKGDSTYKPTNFTDFSFVFGLGPAPQEQIFSFLVKVIIFVCFCLPLLVMLAGLGYLVLRRFRRNGDTELLLAAES